jgi:hypothetical protein
VSDDLRYEVARLIHAHRCVRSRWQEDVMECACGEDVPFGQFGLHQADAVLAAVQQTALHHETP